MSLNLLVKAPQASDPILTDLTDRDDEEGLGRIRCPRCTWRPSPSSIWCCDCTGTPEPPFDSCGTMWNTFATRGRCPGCRHQWRWTTCHRCLEPSLHGDWYDDGDAAP